MERRVDRLSGREHQIVLGVTVVALLLRLYKLGDHSFWFDEGREILRIQTPWPELLFISDGADPPLFRLIHHPISLLTSSEIWLRMPAVLFSVTAVYLAFVWLNQLKRPRLGLMTAVLLAIAPVQIYYAQEVSQYSMTVALTLLLLITFERAGKHGRLRDWILLTVTCIISIYSYYGLAWLFPVFDLDLAWRTWKKRSRQQAIGFLAFHLWLGASIFVLYNFYLAEQFARVTRNEKVSAVFVNPGLMASLRRLDTQLFSEFATFLTTPFSLGAPDIVTWFFIALFFFGLLALSRHQNQAHLSILLVSLFLAIYVAYGYGFYPFGHRYGLLLSPLIFTAVSAGILWLWTWRPAGMISFALVIFIFIAFLPNLPFSPNPWLRLPRENIRPAVQHMNERLAPSDHIFVYYGAVPAYGVYQPTPPVPTTIGSWFRSEPLPDKLAEIETAVGTAPRFWLIMSHLDQNERDELIDGLIDSNFDLSDRFIETNAEVMLFTAR
ncbi:MAG: glycosyltransferase family 39 protein [Chloroflexota bacterium]